MASATVETIRRIYYQAFENILAVLEGKRPPNPVNQAQDSPGFSPLKRA
jgi:lactate dehydrogenase-like 2-hydroxyacid dehydrogenase